MTNQPATMSMPVGEFDPDIAAILDEERDRQQNQLEMIASENFVPRAVLECQGSVLTNKYAEGYPGRRYYGGCEAVDKAEELAIERAKAVFGADYANVQPHSGASANAALLAAVANAGDTIMGLALDHGGHLTHGMKLNFSGKLYNATAYQVDKETFRIDMDQVREAALKNRPKVLIAGWSAYPRHIDFQAFREIADEVGAVLWTDMAHFAGLVAAGLHPSPVPDSDVVTTTVHKTLGGPRSGMILSSRAEQWAKKLNSAVFPGQQGGPLMHVVAAKAVAMKVAQSDDFKDRQRRTIEGAQILAERLNGKDVAGCGITLLTGGTDVHLVMVDLRNSVLDGKKGEALMHDCGITINRNTVPWDPRPPMTGSGLRIGTAALATRGFGQEEFREVADVIAEALVGACRGDVDTEALKKRTRALADKKPLYAGLSYAGPNGTTWE